MTRRGHWGVVLPPVPPSPTPPPPGRVPTLPSTPSSPATRITISSPSTGGGILSSPPTTSNSVQSSGASPPPPPPLALPSNLCLPPLACGFDSSSCSSDSDYVNSEPNADSSRRRRPLRPPHYPRDAGTHQVPCQSAPPPKQQPHSSGRSSAPPASPSGLTLSEYASRELPDLDMFFRSLLPTTLFQGPKSATLSQQSSPPGTRSPRRRRRAAQGTGRGGGCVPRTLPPLPPSLNSSCGDADDHQHGAGRRVPCSGSPGPNSSLPSLRTGPSQATILASAHHSTGQISLSQYIQQQQQLPQRQAVNRAFQCRATGPTPGTSLSSFSSGSDSANNSVNSSNSSGTNFGCGRIDVVEADYCTKEGSRLPFAPPPPQQQSQSGWSRVGATLASPPMSPLSPGPQEHTPLWSESSSPPSKQARLASLALPATVAAKVDRLHKLDTKRGTTASLPVQNRRNVDLDLQHSFLVDAFVVFWSNIARTLR